MDREEFALGDSVIVTDRCSIKSLIGHTGIAIELTSITIVIRFTKEIVVLDCDKSIEFALIRGLVSLSKTSVDLYILNNRQAINKLIKR